MLRARHRHHHGSMRGDGPAGWHHFRPHGATAHGGRAVGAYI